MLKSKRTLVESVKSTVPELQKICKKEIRNKTFFHYVFSDQTNVCFVIYLFTLWMMQEIAGSY